MTRVKGSIQPRIRRHKVLKEAQGYFGSKHRLFKTAQEQLFHSGAYAFRDRRQKKRSFRKLWITRINAACRVNQITYSKFINGLNRAGVKLDRKMLAALAIDNPQAFAELVTIASTGQVKKSTSKVVIPVKTEKPEVKVPTPAYSQMTVVQLRALAKEQGIKGCSALKKDELIAKLK